MKKQKSQTAAFITIAVVALIWGFMLGRMLASDNITTNYSCLRIAQFHQDRLMRLYNIDDGFNTDSTNPNRDRNQRASDLNRELLSICLKDPTK